MNLPVLEVADVLSAGRKDVCATPVFAIAGDALSTNVLKQKEAKNREKKNALGHIELGQNEKVVERIRITTMLQRWR